MLHGVFDSYLLCLGCRNTTIITFNWWLSNHHYVCFREIWLKHIYLPIQVKKKKHSFFTPALVCEIFIPPIFCLHVNDYVGPMVIFTKWAKFIPLKLILSIMQG